MIRFACVVTCGVLAAASGAGAQIVTGAGMGAEPRVRITSPDGRSDSFLAYTPSFTGGVRVVTGDLTGDGVADIITGAGPGGGPHVKVFSGATHAEVRSFLAFDAAFTGGVYVASGDVNGDGVPDIITGAGAGAGGHVRMFNGTDGALLGSFFAYTPSFTGGVRVATGDVNGDGVADVITGAGPGGGPHVKVFNGASGAELASFFAYDTGFAGGVFVSAGDIDGDGRADIITGPDEGGASNVRVFSGADQMELGSFFAYGPNFMGGVRVATGDVDGDGVADIITGAGPGGGPHVRAFSGAGFGELASFFAGAPGEGGDVYVGGVIPGPSCVAALVAAGVLGVRRRRRAG